MIKKIVKFFLRKMLVMKILESNVYYSYDKINQIVEYITEGKSSSEEI